LGVQKPRSIFLRQLVTPGTVMVRPLLLKPQWMNGLSERLLVSHYENNYGGALRRLNAIRARLAALDRARTPVFEINGLKRKELIAAGSVILHEVYFDSLGGHGDNPPTGLIEPPVGLAQALERDFGVSWPDARSLPRWRRLWQEVQAGRSSRGLSAWAGWSTNGRQTMRTACQGLFRSSRSTCTSMPIISILARRRLPMSIR
jgi:hypothetical protein